MFDSSYNGPRARRQAIAKTAILDAPYGLPIPLLQAADILWAGPGTPKRRETITDCIFKAHHHFAKSVRTAYKLL